MALSFSTKGNLKNLINKLSNVDRGFNSGESLENIAKLVNSAIQVRVQKDGLGILGKKMKPYSGPYGTYKENSGRQVGFRDLTYSGSMWQSLTTSRGRNQAKMFFGNAESVNKASGNNKRTPFFGIGEKEKLLIRRELNKLISNL